MKIVVANSMAPFIHGGAEELASQLVRRLIEHGHEVELLRLPFQWEPYSALPKQVSIAGQVWLDRADKVIALKFPAYLIPHQDKSVWMLHQFRQAYDLYDVGQSSIPNGAEGNMVRKRIEEADTRALLGAQQLFANSQVTRERLAHYNGIQAEVLFPPLNDPGLFHNRRAQSYVFAGGRINSMKRQELLVRALALTPANVKLVVAGPPEDDQSESRLRQLAGELGVADRLTLDLRFLARNEIAAWVNNAAASAYIPYDEDSLGYVAMEAAEARKPVITCSDSGGILGLVRDGDTGWVAEPNAQSLAIAIAEAVSNPREARNRGAALHDHWKSFNATWPQTIDRLLA